MRSTVAIIVPLFNEVEQLPGLLKMLDGLHADEVVLVDGGSEDGTPDMLEQFLHPSFRRSEFRWLQSAKGRAVQMNAGASACQSDTLLFLHADSELDPAAIAAARSVMADHRIAGGRFDLKLSGAHPVLRLIERMINLRSRFTKISTGDQAMFIRRELLEQLGGFPEQPLMEDVEFSRRLKQKGRIACLRDTVTTSSRRWEQCGIFRTILLMWKLRFLYWAGVPPERLAAMYRDAR
ncbi:MAG: TIGR04283 family arsenosugar biosynthesis glycosyltransferase [Mariprofundaceae bacterium]|nr:TIGR04283 family arsenosugar biosynthesis glycosyltransferase [Mariprofundaceae bacterium]